MSKKKALNEKGAKISVKIRFFIFFLWKIFPSREPRGPRDSRIRTLISSHPLPSFQIFKNISRCFPWWHHLQFDTQLHKNSNQTLFILWRMFKIKTRIMSCEFSAIIFGQLNTYVWPICLTCVQTVWHCQTYKMPDN